MGTRRISTACYSLARRYSTHFFFLVLFSILFSTADSTPSMLVGFLVDRETVPGKLL